MSVLYHWAMFSCDSVLFSVCFRIALRKAKLFQAEQQQQLLLSFTQYIPCIFTVTNQTRAFSSWLLDSKVNHNRLKKLVLSTKKRLVPEKLGQLANESTTVCLFFPMPAHECCYLMYPSGFLISWVFGCLLWLLACDPIHGARHPTKTRSQLYQMLILPHSSPVPWGKSRAVTEISPLWESGSIPHLCSCSSLAILP